MQSRLYFSRCAFGGLANYYAVSLPPPHEELRQEGGGDSIVFNLLSRPTHRYQCDVT